MRIAALQWLHYLTHNLLISSELVLYCIHLASAVNSYHYLAMAHCSEREGSNAAAEKEGSNEKANTVADLIYCVSQQVSPCLPSSENRGIQIDAVN